MNFLSKLYNKVCKMRLSEGHIGILKLHLFWKVLCNYTVANNLLTFSLSLFKPIKFCFFSLNIKHNTYRANVYYPVIGIELTVLGLTLIDNEKAAYAELKRTSAIISEEYRKRKEAENALIKKAPAILKVAVDECNPSSEIKTHWRTDALNLLEEVRDEVLAL